MFWDMKGPMTIDGGGVNSASYYQSLRYNSPNLSLYFEFYIEFYFMRIN